MFVCYKCFFFDRIDVLGGTDVNKTSESNMCDICYFWYFLNKGFQFQLDVCNRCHDLLMMSMNLSNIAILNIKGADYRCIISGIIKSEAINLMQNINLTKKATHKKTKKIIITYRNE